MRKRDLASGLCFSRSAWGICSCCSACDHSDRISNFHGMNHSSLLFLKIAFNANTFVSLLLGPCRSLMPSARLPVCVWGMRWGPVTPIEL